MSKKKLTFREWASLLLIGLAGQLAWCIENNYINMWIFSQTQDAKYITWMTIASAIAATLTTFFMGVLSDRLGKRKIFIAGGYTIWGISVFLFGLFSYNRMSAAYGAAAASLAIGIWMSVTDCLMTFFGSTANDACFNAHVTDVTSEENRGKVESILSVLPLFANIIVLVLAGVFGANSALSDAQKEAVSAAGGDPTDFVTSANYLAQPWLYFFLAFGALTSLIGIVSFFLLPKDEIQPNKETNYWSNLIYGFRPSVIKKNKNLYIALLAFMAFNAAIDAFMPYYMVYFQNADNGLGLEGMDFYLLMGIILVGSSLIVIVVGLFMDKIGKLKLILPGLALTSIGFLVMYFSKEKWAVAVSGLLLMSGYLIGTATLGAIIRDETPEKEVGLFQGVRMIFVVMIPMIVGSKVSEAIMAATGASYTTSLGSEAINPTNVMFLVGLGFALLALAPAIWLLLSKKKEAPKEPLPPTNDASER